MSRERPWDLIVIGGGIAGASVAFHVLRRAPWRVLLLERAADLGTGATGKATGGIRHQFGTEVNVRLTQLSYPYFVHAEELLAAPWTSSATATSSSRPTPRASPGTGPRSGSSSGSACRAG